MRRLSLRLSLAAVSVFGFALPTVCQTPASSADQPSEEAEILVLKRKVVEQDQRINQLEQQVQALLGQQKAPTNPAGSESSRPAESAGRARSPVVVSSTVESAAAVQKPQPQPEKTFRTLLSPIHFGGNVYLYQYVPLGISGAHPKFELYAFSALVDGQKGPWGFHADYRFRTTKLRSFFPGNTWLQQGYVRYRTSYGEFKAGSFYRRVGIEWDDSFFGNIQYFDGFKLDPEFGVGFEGSHELAGRLNAEYSMQYFSANAPVNGSLPGRDFVSEPGARAKNDVTMRFAPVWHFSKSTSLNVGGSFAHGTIERDTGPHNQRRQAAADATLQLGSLLAYGEVLRQTVSGQVILPPQDATYTLEGIRWARGRYQPRLNYSQANYHGLNGRREYILQPGINIRLADNLTFIYEFDFWRELSVMKPTTVDRSLNLVLLYHF
ncbi:MAG: hypothetical protein EPN47_07760 [Acidobacteria bacterium]|nr:MAG: hypothetical protein EPN47_07760 [Acidobacteriota bacterium]